ncbi:MAG: amino acid ABC transporter permease [Oscillatoriales cyanobacterium]|nr:MAG: amino acid ABC transporter permease [Oscillatoriales cyanobacterium]TAE00554.1 MAG: amino acid ABC transporter permease [Oscillatoriales cyanobacterium]TAF00586.1 MAG: amino acid ABC transporter permease [Oscillatoriales cyanobacterium]TAF37856.1 MAG: amino acid ABC transporter permease [Oscillatoriales cyanobacterium]TAF65220.1 MAG: amino acid ABC transporter permease [Oscillatoriales cyanobacterium]
METIPVLPPPATESPTPWNWARKNLFSTWYNSILTVICLIVSFQVITGIIVWATTKAQWRVLEANLPLFFVGRFPSESYWRLWIVTGIITLLAGLTWGNIQRQERLWNPPLLILLGAGVVGAVISPIDLTSRLYLLGIILAAAASYFVGRQMNPNPPSPPPTIFRHFRHWGSSRGIAPTKNETALPSPPRSSGGLGGVNWIPAAWAVSFPVILWLIKGGLGLTEVSTNDWGGLVLTLFLAVVSIVLSFPLGVLLALGRQSTLPVVKLLSTLYIEIIRGLPLIGILFLGQVMLQLFLPPEYPKLDRVIRAIAGLTLFSAAYLAENVRGGLQAVPRGQIEAARAIGLNTPLLTLLILLPQALRTVIPAIGGQFIGLFMDTSLLSLFGMLELIGISRAVLANPSYIGRYAEVYIFIGIIYWVFCYSMSLASRQIEKTLGVGQR